MPSVARFKAVLRRFARWWYSYTTAPQKRFTGQIWRAVGDLRHDGSGAGNTPASDRLTAHRDRATKAKSDPLKI